MRWLSPVCQRRRLRTRSRLEGTPGGSSRNLGVTLFSCEQVGRMFLGQVECTKHAIAQILAKRFPEELGFLLPPKRRPWMSEDYRMDIFEAISLALAAYGKRTAVEKSENQPNRPAMTNASDL
jgi:hypothetical protein